MSWSNWFDGFSSWLFTAVSTSEIIALSAVVLSWRTIKQNQKHNELSFRPKLTDKFEQSDFHISLLLTNAGTGPAHIESFELLKNGSRVFMDGFQRDLKERNKSIERVFTEFMGKGSSMLAGHSFEVFQIRFNKELATAEDIKNVASDLYKNYELIINYKCNYQKSFYFKTSNDLKH